MAASISVEFCGEWYRAEEGGELSIGREADLVVDEDNPYLHRRFLTITQVDSLWWLSNVGSRLSATITDSAGALQAWLAPGARLPLVFDVTKVVFTAGPTTYELDVHTETPEFERSPSPEDPVGETTVGSVQLTESQKQLILALAEPMLVREGSGMSAVPTSAQAAERLGWPRTKFNRKLDNVCDKLDRMGVRGLRGGPGKLASNRRARLVEHAVFTRLVTAEDLPLLDRATADADADED
ncbi:hypothetical protein Bra3105_17005 [Brachybacterium halotolerans subsp. kimchii]|uniref:hypothetical protein n=1 Tax=Brachybacterium TaxID=43668 RepID=UPI001E65D003|nr:MULTISPECIES: hypothetical protein [Brachybacterium]MCG7308224.1 hypothetical protein [Brachybacterium sp. ACRRE]UEJ82507.1 hypothetical protein Bra3105_17005 [Brachybacterium halotolerans subsp. kimchii]